MEKSLITFILLLTTWTGSLCVHGSECPAKLPKGINFSVSSRKNKTGHWNALVHLRHGNNINDNSQPDSASWDVNVNQISENCGDWENVDITVGITALPSRSAPGYDLVPGIGYYKLHTTLKSWPEARRICSDEGGHLAVLNSEKEKEALRGIFSLNPKITDGRKNEYAHIGFHDLYEEGKFLTIFGETIQAAGYSQFDPGQPNEGRNGNCGCMSRLGGLHDVGCIYTLAFFCEKETMS